MIWDTPERRDRLLTDGGFESVDDVRDVLDSGYVFELTYRTDGDRRTLLVTHDEIKRPSARPLHGPPVFRFRLLTGEKRLTVDLPSLVALHRVSVEQLADPLRESIIKSMVHDLSDTPKNVPLTEVEAVLRTVTEADVESAQQLALNTLRARDRAEAFEQLGERLFPLLRGERTSVGTLVLREIQQHAASQPAAVEPYVSELTSMTLDSAYRAGAVSCLATLAEDDPGHILDAVAALETTVDAADDNTRKWTMYAYTRVATAYPEALFPVLDSIVAGIGDENESVRTNALSALGRIAGQYPDAAVAVVDELADLLDHENPTVRGNATGLLADIAQEHPEPVIQHAEALAGLLTDDSVDVRSNAAIALVAAGGANPKSVEAEHEQLEAALEDTDATVRANACTLIGNAHAPVPVERLEELRESDPDERVRERAAWALERLS